MSNKLSVATTVNVYIPDYTHGVPGSTLPIWQYREKVDPNWQPGPDYPGITAKPLPDRRRNMALSAVQESYKIKGVDTRREHDYGRLPTTNPIVQAVGRSDSLDLRHYQTTRWVNPGETVDGQKLATGQNIPLPPEQHYPCGSAASMFLNTVHYCFAEHYPLGIRPECLMWMVLHEIGVTVKQNAETYRHLFTDSAEKKLIDVQVNGLDIHMFDQKNVWAYGIKLLHTGLRGAMPSDLMQHLLPEISTHDLDSETASMVAVLDAATPYYDYLMRTCCGIPAIRLFGSGEDYDSIVRACEQLAERFSEHLGEYFKHLLPVLNEIADTATGRKQPDNDFWSSIYNHYSGSGRDDMDGWITVFVNYKFGSGKYYAKPAELYDWRANLEHGKQRYGRGIHREDIPNHLSCVPFVWNYGKNHGGQTEGEFAGRNFKLDNGGNGANFDCRLIGGFLAVDDIDGYATPALSYAIIRGNEIVTKVNGDGATWTVEAEGQTSITAKKRSVYAASNPDGRIDIYPSNKV